MSRRFTEDEARRIFARVAERQARAAPDAGGLTLDDLQEAARAAGLDPRLVASAASELDHPEARPARRVAGAPVETRASRVVAGALTDETWATMVAAARAQFGGAGTAGQIGPRREWTLVSGGAKNGVVTQLAAEPVPGGIRLTLSQSVRDMALGFTIGGGITGILAVVFTVLAATGVEPELWIPVGILVAQSLLFLGGTQIGTRMWHRRRTTQFEALLDRLELAAHSARPATPAETASDPASARASGPLLDVDDGEPLPDPLLDSGAAPARGRSRA